MLLRRLGRLINHWVAVSIARREREVARAMLYHFSDRELKDIGASVAARSTTCSPTKTRR